MLQVVTIDNIHGVYYLCCHPAHWSVWIRVRLSLRTLRLRAKDS